MRAWIPQLRHTWSRANSTNESNVIYVLSRVTLGADIKITSIILDAMKHRFPEAAIVLVGNRKSDQLYFADSRISQLIADYPRSGSVTERIQFAPDLRDRLEGPNRIVIDPDSRMTQLGLIPVCEPERYFHFPSRSADSTANLTDLTQGWVLWLHFAASGRAYIAPDPVPIEGEAPRVSGEPRCRRQRDETCRRRFRIAAHPCAGRKVPHRLDRSGRWRGRSSPRHSRGPSFGLHRSRTFLGRLIRRLRIADRAIRSLRRIRFRRTARRRRIGHTADLDLCGSALGTLPEALVPARPGTHSAGNRSRFRWHPPPVWHNSKKSSRKI